MRFGLVVPDGVFQKIGTGRKQILLPDSTRLILLEKAEMIYPGEWSSISVELGQEKVTSDVCINMIFRVFSEIGIKDYPFTFHSPPIDELPF